MKILVRIMILGIYKIPIILYHISQAGRSILWDIPRLNLRYYLQCGKRNSPRIKSSINNPIIVKIKTRIERSLYIIMPRIPVKNAEIPEIANIKALMLKGILS